MDGNRHFCHPCMTVFQCFAAGTIKSIVKIAIYCSHSRFSPGTNKEPIESVTIYFSIPKGYFRFRLFGGFYVCSLLAVPYRAIEWNFGAIFFQYLLDLNSTAGNRFRCHRLPARVCNSFAETTPLSIVGIAVCLLNIRSSICRAGGIKISDV